MDRKQIILFTILLLLIVIISRCFDDYSGDPTTPNISMYIWGMSPLLMTLIFRAYNKDWEGLAVKPNFRKNWKWYGLALLGVPIMYVLKIVIAQLTGNIELTENFSTSLILNSVIGGFVLMFLKNISEEFTWRGYLTYSLDKRGVSRLRNHLIVGTIWVLWHLPYLNRGISFNSGNNFWLSVLMWTMSLLALSVIYGEIRLRSNIVWIPVLLHTFDNILLTPFLTYEMIEILPNNTYLVGLGFDNILSIILFSIIAWMLLPKKYA